MRALLVHPQTPSSFWSLDVVCHLNDRKTLLPPLGLITAAALLPKEWELRLVDMNVQPLTGDHIAWADLVLMSGMAIQREGMFHVLREARTLGKKVVAGGPYATTTPGELREAGCDIVVVGEAENTMNILLALLENGTEQQIVETAERPDLTQSPIPRFDLLRFDDYMLMPIQTSRGCPHDCDFCEIAALYGKKPRFKTPHQVIKELETLYTLGWREYVFISDDNFIGKRSHAVGVLQQLTPWMIEHSYPFSFWTQASVNLGQDVPLIDMMTAANFSTVFIGIESPDEEVLTASRKFQNVKNSLLESVNTITRNGLTVTGSFIIGLDGEKPGVADRICSFIDETNIPMVMLNVLQPIPNTRLWTRLEKEGRLREMELVGESIAGRLNFIPQRPEAEILGDYLKIWDHVYNPRNFLQRAYRYYLSMRPTRKAMAEARGEPPSSSHVSPRPPLRQSLKGLQQLFKLSWWMWKRTGFGWQYWQQFLGILRKNPSRAVRYLQSCVIGENMFRLTPMVHQRITSNFSVTREC